MKLPSSNRVSLVRRAAMSAAAVVLVGHAWAAGPWLAGPSILTIAERGTFSGGGFAPAASVQVRTQDPTGNQSVVQVQAGADGSLVIEVAPAVEGLHTLSVLDSAGAVLTSASFLSRP